MPRRERDTCGETPEAKEETQEEKKKEDYHPKTRRKTHTQVWGAALYYMKGCWPRSRNCFLIASASVHHLFHGRITYLDSSRVLDAELRQLLLLFHDEGLQHLHRGTTILMQLLPADRKSTRLNSSHKTESRMPSSA